MERGVAFVAKYLTNALEWEEACTHFFHDTFRSSVSIFNIILCIAVYIVVNECDQRGKLVAKDAVFLLLMQHFMHL